MRRSALAARSKPVWQSMYEGTDTSSLARTVHHQGMCTGHQLLTTHLRVTAAAGLWRFKPLKIQYLNSASMVTGTMATNK